MRLSFLMLGVWITNAACSPATLPGDPAATQPASETPVTTVEPDASIGGETPEVPVNGTCTLDSTYSFRTKSPESTDTDVLTLSPPVFVQYSAYTFPGPGSSVTHSCTPSLPGCGTPDAIDVGDIITDLADPDVQGALAARMFVPVFGDNGIAENPLNGLTRASGGGFVVDDIDCSTPERCVPTPAGVLRLVADLKALAAAALRAPECAPVR